MVPSFSSGPHIPLPFFDLVVDVDTPKLSVSVKKFESKILCKMLFLVTDFSHADPEGVTDFLFVDQSGRAAHNACAVDTSIGPKLSPGQSVFVVVT